MVFTHNYKLDNAETSIMEKLKLNVKCVVTMMGPVKKHERKSPVIVMVTAKLPL